MKKPYSGMNLRVLGRLDYLTQNSAGDGTCGPGNPCRPYDNDGGGNGGGIDGNPGQPR
jgi:hypothetical protein